MKFSVKKILGVGLAFGLAALNLGAQSATQFGNLPLWFEAGPADKFTAHASDSEFTISSGGAEFALAKKNGQTASGQLQFIGANHAARIVGSQQLTGTINYLFGSQSDQWRTGVSTYGRVQVENIYPGVNVIYYGNRQKLEYDLNLAAGFHHRPAFCRRGEYFTDSARRIGHPLPLWRRVATPAGGLPDHSRGASGNRRQL